MSVTIEFGGKARDLFFGLKEVKELERELGAIPIGAIMGQLSQVSITCMVAALYVGLKGEDKSLNQNLVLKMLDDYIRPVSAGGEGKRIKVIADALSEALDETGLFKPPEEAEEAAATEGGEGNAPGRRRSRSGSSGPNRSASGSSA